MIYGKAYQIIHSLPYVFSLEDSFVDISGLATRMEKGLSEFLS